MINTITREEFLQFKYPLKTDCKIKRGTSNKTTESFQIENMNTGIILNFYWRSDNTVSVSKRKRRMGKQWSKADSILDNFEDFNQVVINKICDKYLKGKISKQKKNTSSPGFSFLIARVVS